jgi:dTDP-4-dehydrorhamnose 3,5-epimerase-like enzyme
MARFIDFDTFTDKRGSLTVIENIMPFEIKRIFYIYDVDDSVRGNHRHHKTVQCAICLNGSCVISVDDNYVRWEFPLTYPSRGLILEPEDYHSMHSFTPGTVLMVLASEYFDPKDYIYEPYR